MPTVPHSDEARDESGHLLRELHGVTLSQILDYLVAAYGWAGLDERIRINCFSVNPSVNSSLKFLRRTSWARAKVEELYIETRTRDLAPKNGRVR
ncbi:VF530 family DNA-binding protein [uncultured Hymenobacter sp.]|uniref:VF530 family protein n=1 Tax=uncultured Hymenobacter sp. TaxID=170016 RepID=UPI0035CAEAC7